MSKTIEEIANDYATIFIVEATTFTLDGQEHWHLVKLFKEFAIAINEQQIWDNLIKMNRSNNGGD